MYTIRQKALPVVLITLACVAMAAVDAILQPTYAAKSAVKWLLFVLVPLLYSAWNQDIFLKSLFAFRKKGIWISFAIGLGLFGTGLFLNYVDEKSQTLYNSYFMHMFANFAINTIGFILFGK